MTTYLGNAGVIKQSTYAIAEVKGFTVTVTEGTVEDTAQGDTAKTFQADGLQAWSGSINAHYFPGDTNGQAVLVEGATVDLTLNPIGTTTGLENLTGSALITSVQIGESANAAIVPVAFQFTGSGALSRGTNS